MNHMNELQKTIKDVAKLEKNLLTFVLSSFIFSLLAVVAQYDKFTLAFKAITEIIAGTAGASGVLSAYLGKLRHAKDEPSFILEFQPQAQRILINIGLIISVGAFYFYYMFTKSENEICLLFLLIGIFIFFKSLTKAVLTLRISEQQRFIWRNLSTDEKRDWIRRQENLARIADDLDSAIQEFRGKMKGISNDIKENEKIFRRAKRKSFFKKTFGKTRKIRKFFGGNSFLTTDEKMESLEAEEFIKNLQNEINEENIKKIREGKITPLVLETSKIKIFNIQNQKYFLIENDLDKIKTKKLLGDLKPLRDENTNKFENLLAVIPKSIQISFEASELVTREGIDIYRE